VTRSSAVFLVAMGCYTPPPLPLIDEVPIEGPDFVPCASDEPEARVACVIDGAAFDQERCLGEGQRLQLLGAAAPVGDECFAPESEAWLTEVLEGEEVYLSFDATCLHDGEGRLAYVWATGDLLDDLRGDARLDDLVDEVGDDDEPALLVNEVAIRLGFARYDGSMIPGGPYFEPRMQRAETDAQQEGIGLFGVCGEDD